MKYIVCGKIRLLYFYNISLIEMLGINIQYISKVKHLNEKLNVKIIASEKLEIPFFTVS